jgi:hypothetical protein
LALLGRLSWERVSGFVMQASEKPAQERTGCWCLVIGILDQHSHFATNALQAHRHLDDGEECRPR